MSHSRRSRSVLERTDDRAGSPWVSVVAAARPNFMKVGPVIRALEGKVVVELIHTGQHYDHRMSAAFFHDLGLPEPDVHLGVGSGTHAEQTAGVMIALERHLKRRPPNAVVVVGDVNSTVASALTAVRQGVPVAHVEAGLRSNDWDMPEEINRILTDRVSSWLFTTSEDADKNLESEGIHPDRIHRVGNVMIDTLMANLDRARRRTRRLRTDFGLMGRYALLTLHRPSNVDEGAVLSRILNAVSESIPQTTCLLPLHPRTAASLERLSVEVPSSIRCVDPMGYLDFVALMTESDVVFTDSGGIQEETSILGIPCVTLRNNTERPITCSLGSNVLAGTDRDSIVAATREALRRRGRTHRIPLWDGHAGERIGEILVRDLGRVGGAQVGRIKPLVLSNSKGSSDDSE